MLVKRHGPMVWGVARRLLRSHQDAEDAFQASFLVLARKAASLRQPQLLTSWLHGVAHRTALHLRGRHKYVVPLDAEHEPVDDTPDQLAWRDCGNRIDQAIEELPTSLRMVFLLCQAEGLTTLAASRRLNLPEGTVVSRLHRARKQLQRLLARHGITSAAGAIVACWSLALPESLSALTVRTLLGSAPSALVAGLAQGVLTTMMWIKATTAAFIVSTMGLVGAGTTTIIAQGSGGKVAEQSSVALSQVKKDEDEIRIRKLMKELETARNALAQATLLQKQAIRQEQILRDQLESLRKDSVDVRRFLEKDVLAQERRSTVNPDEKESEADLDLKRAKERQEVELRKKQEAERQRLVMMQQAQAHQERRAVDLMKAKEQLTNEMGQLQKQQDEMQAKGQAMQQEMQSQQFKLESLKQDLEKEIHDAETQSNSDKVKALKAKREELLATARNNAFMHAFSAFSNTQRRLEAQLKLRDKLLLEVDEKLLRMQLKLDEK